MFTPFKRQFTKWLSAFLAGVVLLFGSGAGRHDLRSSGI